MTDNPFEWNIVRVQKEAMKKGFLKSDIDRWYNSELVLKSSIKKAQEAQVIQAQKSIRRLNSIEKEIKTMLYVNYLIVILCFVAIVGTIIKLFSLN